MFCIVTEIMLNGLVLVGVASIVFIVLFFFFCSTERKKNYCMDRKMISGYLTVFQHIVRCIGVRTERILQASRT